MLDRLAAAAMRVPVADAAAVLLFDETGDHLTVAAGQGFPAGFLEVKPLPLSESTLDREARSKGVALADVGAADPFGLGRATGLTDALAVRLGPAARPLGVLHVYSATGRQFGHAEIALVQGLAELGGAAIESAHGLAALARLEAEKAQFIRVATHELRSPVTVSQSLVRTVLRGYAGSLTDRQRAVFDRISRQLDSLENLINDLLDLAASRASGLAGEEGPVAVMASVGRAVLLLQPRAEEKGVALKLQPCREELAVWASEEGLDRVFVNLVGNAVKYTSAGGQVIVSLGRRGDDIQVDVADTGIGIPEESIPHLFEEFYRAPNARKLNTTGTGLGLAIVKELVERYGGQIRVQSEPGVGTTFTVLFPAYRLA